MSKGEQQLLALARAILRKQDEKTRKILVLDKATSNVDGETDRLVQEVIKEEFEGYIVLSVAHRIEYTQYSDMMLVLDGGGLVKFDTAERMLEMGGLFEGGLEGIVSV